MKKYTVNKKVQKYVYKSVKKNNQKFYLPVYCENIYRNEKLYGGQEVVWWINVLVSCNQW